MVKFLTVIACFILNLAVGAASDVLIVADEIPAMKILAGKLTAEEHLASKIVTQADLPSALSSFTAIIVYIHLNLQETAERAFIQYTKAGGKLVVLHHSISSGKRKNKEWFSFLGVSLPEGGVAQGGYQWIEPATLTLVNLAPDHFITTHKLNYPQQIVFKVPGGTEKTLPGFTLPASEVYLNHVLTEPRTLLLGFQYADPKTKLIYMQPHAGWIKPAGQGWIIYLMPGHSTLDFENPVYARMTINAVIWKP